MAILPRYVPLGRGVFAKVYLKNRLPCQGDNEKKLSRNIVLKADSIIFAYSFLLTKM
jgi:hypothetical protein